MGFVSYPHLILLISGQTFEATVARHCLGSLDSSRDFARGYGMSFVSYPYLIRLISGQTFKITVVHENF